MISLILLDSFAKPLSQFYIRYAVFIVPDSVKLLQGVGKKKMDKKEGGMGGSQTGGAVSFSRTKQEVFGGTLILLFELGIKYLNFGATYLSFGAIYLSFGAMYLDFGVYKKYSAHPLGFSKERGKKEKGKEK